YGGYELARELNWKHARHFKKTPIKEWTVNGKRAGQYTRSHGLSFVRIYDAGHEAPFYQPENSLYMFDKWIYM
ncbi:676_t:CDS:1, partial [Ambispora gerdemannii]